MTTPVTLHSGASSRVVTGGVSVPAIWGPSLGGRLANPPTGAEQGLELAEVLYYSLAGPAVIGGRTTFALQPGAWLEFPAGVDTTLWVNAVSSGHKFSVFTAQPPPAPAENAPSTFPPVGPTGLVKTLPSYLYQQYTEDDDLQAFVSVQNEMTQSYVDWFNSANLPIYPRLSGALLDFVGEGLYGMARPVFSAGRRRLIGPLNTFGPNVLPLNVIRQIGPSGAEIATDDIYKRVLTWHFFKGDGKYFTTRWLKRRIRRFLFGEDGWDTEGETNQISVQFGANRTLNITIIGGERRLVGGAIANTFAPNARMPNEYTTQITQFMIPALARLLKEGLDTGILEMPYQYTVVVNILVVTATTGGPRLFIATDTGLWISTESGQILEAGP